MRCTSRVVDTLTEPWPLSVHAIATLLQGAVVNGVWYLANNLGQVASYVPGFTEGSESETGTWQTLKSSSDGPVGYYPTKAAYASAGSLFVMSGGKGRSGSDMVVMDTAADQPSWSKLDVSGNTYQMPRARMTHGMVAIGTKLYFVGGNDPDDRHDARVSRPPFHCAPPLCPGFRDGAAWVSFAYCPSLPVSTLAIQIPCSLVFQSLLLFALVVTLTVCPG